MPSSPEILVRSDLPKDDTSTISGTIRESSPESVPQADGLSDGSDTDYCMDLDSESSSEQYTLFVPIPAVQNNVYITTQSQTAMPVKAFEILTSLSKFRGTPVHIIEISSDICIPSLRSP